MKTHTKAHLKRHPYHHFSYYLDDPLVASLLATIALLTLMFALMQFARVVSL